MLIFRPSCPELAWRRDTKYRRTIGGEGLAGMLWNCRAKQTQILSERNKTRGLICHERPALFFSNCLFLSPNEFCF